MTTCPACKYTRKPTDTAPAYRCPRCGQNYPDEGSPRSTEKAEPQLTKQPPSKAASANHFCNNCHSYFDRTAMRGSGWIEFILYFFYFVPGIIYSIWRRGKSGAVCPKCKSSSYISADAGTHVKCPACRELVLADARKCKHCGTDLSPQA